MTGEIRDLIKETPTKKKRINLIPSKEMMNGYM